MVKFSIYKDYIEEKNFIINTSYLPGVKRNNLNSKFYIYNYEKSNNLVELVKEFFYQYYELCARDYEVMVSLNGHGEFTYEHVKYDEKTGALLDYVNNRNGNRAGERRQ